MLIENNFKGQSPIIVIGMHRSGTTMMVSVLENFGLHMGGDQEVNKESKHYLNINNWILSQIGCSWDDPSNVNMLNKDVRIKNLVKNYVKFFEKSPRSFLYWGLRGGRIGRANGWGWKDPRNTFTLPLWLEIHPNAKVILMERNGLPVAESLQARREKYVARAESRFWFMKYFYLLRKNRQPFGGSILVATLDEGISLWHRYLNQGRLLNKELGNRCLKIKYEEFLSNPELGLRNIVDFVFSDVNISMEDKFENIMKGLKRDTQDYEENRICEISQESRKMLLAYEQE